jgi:acetyl-CoA acetyltransferase
MIGSFVGALLGIVARVADRIEKKDKTDHAAVALSLRRAVEALARSRALLVDHIELLERELATERRMSAHWLGEAQRLIRDDRRREAVLAPQMAQSYQQNMALYQLAQAQQNALAQQNQQLGAQNLDAGIWCNCVPSRAQVWGAQGGLVRQLNEETW